MKLLLTGPPRCGKTTLVERVVERVRGSLHLAGFFTREVREHGDRTGFDVITVGGRHGVLSRKSDQRGPRVGKYVVDVWSFETVGVAALDDKAADAFVVDEIGVMELHSDAFKRALQGVLDGPRPLVATIRYSPEPFCDAVKRRPDVAIIEVSPYNRNELVEGISMDLLRACGKGQP